MKPSIRSRTSALVVALAFAVPMWLACNDDGTMPGRESPPLLVFKNLTERGDVLTNVEAAYNYRKIDKYSEALDANFTFFLSPGDVGGGLPDQWDRTTEVTVNTRLFNKNYAALPCQDIYMDIRSEEGVTWSEVHPASAPTETWYSTTLFYDFKFQINPNTYIPLPGAKAVFTVRDAGPTGSYQHHWQLVELRDLGGASFSGASSSSTEPSTLGQVKALYR